MMSQPNGRRSFLRYCSRAAPGFTLIELLVVIAIIAILAAILFPVFAQAREKARQTACLSNEKQIGLGILQYVQDYDETLPIGRMQGCGGTTGDNGWAVTLSPYIQKVAAFNGNNANNIWACPSDSVDRINIAPSGTSTTNLDSNGQPYPRQSYSYAMGYLAGTNGPFGKYPAMAWTYQKISSGACKIDEGAAMAALKAPANTIIVVEENNPTFFVGGNATGITAPNYTDGATAQGSQGLQQDCGSTTNPTNTACTKFIKPVHSEGWNYLYGDGHAKWKKPAQTIGDPTKQGVGDPGNQTYTCSVSRPCGDWTLNDTD